MTDTVNLADPKLYNIVNENKENKQEKEQENEQENKSYSTMVIVENKCMNPLMKFLTVLFILALVIFLIYITVYRFFLGYNFFRNKEYMKTAAALSPELVALSTSILL